MSADNEDEDLLARLNALKTSSVSLNPNSTVLNPFQSDTESPEHDLISRFGKLGGSIAPSHRTNVFHQESNEDTVDNEEDDQTLEELLNELKNEDDWKLEKGEEQSARDLLGEATAALKESKTNKPADDNVDALEKPKANAQPALAAEPSAEPDKAEPQLSEEQEADEYIRRALEEASLDDQPDEEEEKPPPYERLPQSDNSANDETAADTSDDPFANLPSVPEDLPVTPQKDPSQSSLFPSAPSFKPSDKRSPKSNLPTYTDEDIESWCVICNDDATLKCIGCDGDLYCLSCWNEGHTGPDAGFEERTHRCVQYSRKPTQAAA